MGGHFPVHQGLRYMGVKWKMTKKIIVTFWLGLLLISLVQAQEIIINKTAPLEIRLDEILGVRIEVGNGYEKEVSVLLKEIIDFGEPLDKEFLVQPQEIIQRENETIIDNITWDHDGKCDVGCTPGDGICEKIDCGCTFRDDPDCAIFVISEPPRYEWNFVLEPYSKKEIFYRVKPLTLGLMEISPTVAETVWGKFYSSSLIVKVKCNADGICQGLENFKNCPQDCSSGGGDEYCDGIVDGICDPDCPKEVDPDCLPPMCGDDICEKERGEDYKSCPQDCERPAICGDGSCEKKENYGNCPQDCPSGSKDGYCDAVKDGKCDSDCPRNVDEDCFCNKDGFCEVELENYGNCPEDCKSGSKDGYCDGIKDEICDLDCEAGEDADCGKNYYEYLLLLLLIFFIFLAYLKLRKFIAEK
jgi:hypothetical protein